MKESKKPETITVDVRDISLGRAASKAAFLLRGKDRPDFAYHRAPLIIIEIKNYDKVKIGTKKMAQKVYIRYTGYPSGLRKTKLSDLYKKDSKMVFRKAVWGMLPKNKLRKVFIKNLVFSANGGSASGGE
ncbi:uL13 family ribosomal protein [Patescibacteria group bacterium]|nr:uL13 family ribosomal protein [Patescibacteria group bacterium]